MPVTAFPRLLLEGLRKVYAQGYAQIPERYKDLYETIQTHKQFEDEVQFVGTGYAQVKPQGESAVFDFMQQGYAHRAVMVAYSLGFIITYEEFKDNLYLDYGSKRAKALAFSQRQTMEVTAANIPNRGFNSSYTSNPGDGQPLFSTAHPLVEGGTAANRPAAGSDLNELSLETGTIAIMDFVNDRNLNIAVSPVSLHIPTASYYNAKRILNSALQSHTANNAQNVLNTENVFPGGVKVNNYFTDANAWFIKTNCLDGMIHYEREAANFDQDNEFATKNFQCVSYARYAFNWNDWRSMYGNPGA